MCTGCPCLEVGPLIIYRLISDFDKDNLDEAGARDDKAEGTSSNVNTRRVKRDESLQNTFATSQLASAPKWSLKA
jgi:hypothetical protein